MANKQIDMRKAKQIFKLYGEGKSKRGISRQLGISRNTVTKYIDFFKRYKLTSYEVSAMTLEEIHRLFRSDQKPKSEQSRTLEKYFPYFDRELRRTGVTKQSLWEEYYEKHPDGFKLSQFRYWYREWTKEVSPVMHFTHKAGDKLFIDFTGKKLVIVDRHTGELQELEVYVCVLGSSQYTYVEACTSQKLEDFMRCTENALWFYGGVPLLALVCDECPHISKYLINLVIEYKPPQQRCGLYIFTRYGTRLRRALAGDGLSNTSGLTFFLACTKALLVNLPAVPILSRPVKFSISRDRLFLKRFNMNNRIIGNRCFLFLVKCSFDTLNSCFKRLLNNSART